jgi:hypothetical protein
LLCFHFNTTDAPLTSALVIVIAEGGFIAALETVGSALIAREKTIAEMRKRRSFVIAEG